MNRIDATFDKLRAAGRAALIPYIAAGDPSVAATVPLMRALTSAGADLIELGVPARSSSARRSARSPTASVSTTS